VNFTVNDAHTKRALPFSGVNGSYSHALLVMLERQLPFVYRLQLTATAMAHTPTQMLQHHLEQSRDLPQHAEDI